MALQGRDSGGRGKNHGQGYHTHLPLSWCCSFQGSQKGSLGGTLSRDQPLGVWGWGQNGSGGTKRIIRVISSPVVFLAIVLYLND